jgi:hypothetical protein
MWEIPLCLTKETPYQIVSKLTQAMQNKIIYTKQLNCIARGDD